MAGLLDRSEDLRVAAIRFGLEVERRQVLPAPVAEVGRRPATGQALPLTLAPVRRHQVRHLQRVITRAMGALAEMMVAVSHSVALVVRSGAPVQVRECVVGAISVFVASLETWRRRTYEGIEHHDVNELRAKPSLVTKCVLGVAILPDCWLQELASKGSCTAIGPTDHPGQGPRPSLIGDLVAAYVSRNRAPFLGLFIHEGNSNARMELTHGRG
jgi:hypothetical protein